MNHKRISSISELKQALDALSQRRRSGDIRPHCIEFAEGDYALNKPLQLRAGEHDALTLKAAAGAEVSLHSLQELPRPRKQQHQGRELWAYSLEGLHPRTLFANGTRRSRATLPSKGAYFHAQPYREGEVPPLHWGSHRIPCSPGDIDPAWQGLADAELVGYHFWTEERLPNLRYDGASQSLISSHRSMYRLTEGTRPLPFRYRIENLFDALSEPGSWCFRSSSAELFYLPLPGETPENTSLAIPVLHRLLDLRGLGYGEEKSGGQPHRATLLRDLHIEGIHFHGSDWIPHQGQNLAVDHLVPEDGLPIGASVQSAFDACAAVRIRYAERVWIEDCRFEQLGGHALRLGPGCAELHIRHNEFSELGGGAILAHGAELDRAVAGRCRNILVADNVIAGIGRVFASACGILGGAVEQMQILHNHIRDSYYSGISLGWTWGYADTVSGEHLVEGNLVEDISQGTLNDLGGIYLVGANRGSILRRNWVRRVHTANFGAQGIYLDEGCRNILIEQNRVEDCGEACINMHYGQGHLIRDNLLQHAHAGIRLSRDDGRATWTAMRNLILHCDSPYSAGYALGNLAESSCQSDLNLIYPGSPEDLELQHPSYLLAAPQPFRTWQAAGKDCSSLFSDPGEDPTTGPEAAVLGFQSYDHHRCGPRERSQIQLTQRALQDTTEF